MPSHYAALLTIGLIAIFAAPIIYYIFWVDGSAVPKPDPSAWGPIDPMSEEDIEKIEFTLQVKLPADYAEFLRAGRSQDVIDSETVSCSVSRIIEATTSYRQGLYGLQPWPASYIYVGDEADACPYVLDCESGRFFQTHKGNLKTNPLSSYASFSEFVEHCEADAINDAEVAARPETWRDTLAFYTPLIIGMLVIFVVVPLLAFSASQLWKWLFGA
jgi:hypothetical protein